LGALASVTSHFARALALHLQVDLGIDVGRVQRNMAEPGTNRVNVHAGAEQVRCLRMPDRVNEELSRPMKAFHASAAMLLTSSTIGGSLDDGCANRLVHGDIDSLGDHQKFASVPQQRRASQALAEAMI